MTQVVCDLDGVVYRGDTAVPGAAVALKRLAERGVELYFVTNNSTRDADAAAAKIVRLTGIEVSPDHVLTSSQAAASLLTPDDGPVLVVGESGVQAAVTDAGLEVTQHPEAAKSVLVGLNRSVTYDVIADAVEAVRAGARFVATNVDPTFPTEEGLKPGAGAIVAAISVASGVQPEIAGKPHPPMRALMAARGISEAWVIGDREDTDVALAIREKGWRSVLVLSGVTGPVARIDSSADFVVQDLTSAVDLVLDHLDRS